MMNIMHYVIILKLKLIVNAKRENQRKNKMGKEKLTSNDKDFGKKIKMLKQSFKIFKKQRISPQVASTTLLKQNRRVYILESKLMLSEIKK